MARVFVINKSTHDCSKASKYGTIVNVTEGNVPIFKIDTIKDMLYKKLKDFKEDDYLLIAGPTLLCIVAYQTVVNVLGSDASIKLLVFDAKEQNYIVRHLSV
jgi:hypothetical protein